MPVSRCGTRVTSTSMPDAAARAHLAGRTRQTRRRPCPEADDRARLHDLETRLHQELLHERIADLHRRTFLRRLVVELGRRHRRAVDAVAAGLGADIEHRVAFAVRGAFDDFVGARDAEAQHVDQRIAGVDRIERDFAPDGRDADAVAVAADACNHAGEDSTRERRIERSKPQRVQQADRSRTHREDVADDAADAGRRTLIRLDE